MKNKKSIDEILNNANAKIPTRKINNTPTNDPEPYDILNPPHSILIEKSSIPTDKENRLSTIEDCLDTFLLFKELSECIYTPEQYQDFVNFIEDNRKKSNASNNQIIKNAHLSNVQIFTLYYIKEWASILNEVIIKAKMRYEDLKDVLKAKTPIVIPANRPQIPLDDLSNILDGISSIFPEFKVPEMQYQDKGLVHDLNYMVSGPPIISGCKALRDKEIWNKDPVSGLAYYKHNKNGNTKSYIKHFVRDWSSEELKLLPFNEATQILDKFGTQTALLHLILAVHTYSNADPTSTRFRLKGTDLIHDLGLGKRTDLSISQKLEIVLEAVNAVRSLIIQAEWESELKQGKKNTKVISSVQPSIMWDISPKVDKQLNLLDKDKEELKEIYIEVKLGSWINHFFNKAGYKMGNALYNFACLAKKILDLDPYHEELALRIALLQSTMPYRSYITVESWLAENLLGYQDKISKARKDRMMRKKLKELWDKTLLALQRIGFNIHFDENTYPENLRPNGKVPRGYFELLLKAKVKITPKNLDKPESAIEHQERLEEHQKRLEQSAQKKSSSSKTYSGSDLKKARESANVKPTAIAKYLDCSKGKIYNAEKRQNISAKLYQEIIDAINYIKKHPDQYQ